MPHTRVSPRLTPAALVLAALLPAAALAQPAASARRSVVAAAAPVSAPVAAPVTAPVTAPVAAPAAHAVAVPEGTEFTAITAEALSSKTASEGDRVALKVDEDVVVNGVVVIAKGANVRASVAEAKSAGFMGRGGKLNLRIESATTVDGQHVPLRANKAKVGDNKTGTTVALTVLFGPLGLLKKGKDASYPEGTRLTVYTDQAVTVTPAAAAPAAP